MILRAITPVCITLWPIPVKFFMKRQGVIKTPGDLGSIVEVDEPNVSSCTRGEQLS